MLTDMPYKIINAFTSNLPLYFMINLRRDAGESSKHVDVVKTDIRGILLLPPNQFHLYTRHVEYLSTPRRCI